MASDSRRSSTNLPRYDTMPHPTSTGAAGPSQPVSQRRPLSRPRSESRRTLLEEILPTPSTASGRGKMRDNNSISHVLRRTGAVAVISIFLLSVIFLASTTGDSGSAPSLRLDSLKGMFGAGTGVDMGSMSSLAEGDNSMPNGSGGSDSIGEVEETTTKPKGKDFEQYTMLQTLEWDSAELAKGRRLIFVGDIHGSLDPLERLMAKIQYDSSTDILIHVGDLIAKGSKSHEVLSWMSARAIRGVRGNHDQPVVQWRAWMEWAGGNDWEAYIDSLSSGGDSNALRVLNKDKKMYPAGWEWKGEHWKIARDLSSENYRYLQQLPLVLHIPTLHTMIVHAGLLASNPIHSSAIDSTQPLLTSHPSRTEEELSILEDIPQNTIPWNLLNMRSIRTEGKHKGEITKSAKKGTPWSHVWAKEMGRCKGSGSWYADGMGEWEAEHEAEGDDEVIEEDEGAKRRQDQDESETSKRDCSPMTVIYGHAAGRGLDIHPYSKGIDTGCVYGKLLTVLILGDVTGLKGKSVRVEDQQGILVHESCAKGGL